MEKWISIGEETPEDGKCCRVLFDDETESEATYLADLGIFALTGVLTSFGSQNVTHWMPNN